MTDQTKKATAEVVRLRGGGAATAVQSTSNGSAAAEGKGKADMTKKVRIPSFDAMRFILISFIVLGHFGRFAEPSEFVLKLISQHNVLVGAFFALSGYMTAYTSTENAERKASPRFTDVPSQKWILGKIFGFYPLHFVTLLLFSPMLFWADSFYNGPIIASLNGFLQFTMVQAWFPQHAESWNAPTWFLSALTFVTALFPFSLPKIAAMDKAALRKTAFWLFIVNLLPKLGFLYDTPGSWKLMEGVIAPKLHPDYAGFNIQRFMPLNLVAEIFLGAIACRLVMLDYDPKEKEGPPKTNALSTLAPLAGIVGMMWLRAAGIVQCSDLIIRAGFFLPLWLRFMISAHRNTVSKVTDPVLALLSNPVLVWLGGLSFPIYIVHGPIGQIFYKKLIAKAVFGKVLTGLPYFGAYLATTLTSAFLLQKLVVENKAIGELSKKSVDKLSKWF